MRVGSMRLPRRAAIPLKIRRLSANRSSIFYSRVELHLPSGWMCCHFNVGWLAVLQVGATAADGYRKNLHFCVSAEGRIA